MTQNNFCTLSIDINKHNKIKCSILTSQNEEQIINIKVKQQEYLPISISFNMNEIIINEERINSIDFFKEWIDHPEEFKLYTINYQNNQHTVIAESLFAFVIKEYKNKIDKQFIIDETIVTIPSKNGDLYNRIQISLESIGLKNIVINPIQHDYQKQGEIHYHILDSYDEFNKYKHLLTKSNQMNLFDNTQPLNEEKFEELSRQLSTKKRSSMGFCHLDNYCVFITSKYFDSIDDHINLVKVCKSFRLNMEKFHFNPLPLTSTTREYFPFLQTLYLYSKDDNEFKNDQRIIARKECKVDKYNLFKNQIDQIEEWTELYFGDILFDSDKENWSEETSIFDDKIKGRKQLLFIIEDDRNEKFGYYLDTIVKNEYNDSYYTWTNIKSFHFNIESNGRLNKMMKFPIKNTDYGYALFDKKNDILIQLGDIILKKENNKEKSGCFQEIVMTFDYQGIPSALCGKSLYTENDLWKGERFTPSRIQAIQMIKTEEQKRIEKEKEMKEIKQLEQWTELQYGDILFDSEFDNWKQNSSIFDDKIKGRKKLLFIIQDDHCEKFGYFLNTEVVDKFNETIKTDYNSFEFNLQSNGRLEKMMKFPIKDTSFGYKLFDKSHKILISLGDITIFKDFVENGSHCNQRENTYYYQGKTKVICGRTGYLNVNEGFEGESFTPIRIQVVQMKMSKEQKQREQENEMKQFNQLEEWIGLKCGDILFDSEFDSLSLNISVFDDRIKEKKQLLFIIEDEDGEKFGYYLNTEIKNEYNEENYFETDELSFYFNLESNGRLNSIMKFPLTNKQTGYLLYQKSRNKLIELGDILLYKDNTSKHSYCKQSNDTFDYNGIQNALCGKSIYLDENEKWKGDGFKIQRLRVIQMELSKEQKQINQIEIWTGLKFGKTIFNSELDDWKINESVFNDKIIGKKQLLFMIEDDRNELFGYYLNTEIFNEYGKMISTDSNSFEFNLESNNQRLEKPMKFDIKNTSHGYKLFDEKNDVLIQLGDIWLGKENGNLKSCCEQKENKFNYQGIENALCGKTRQKEGKKWKGESFQPSKIFVIQMIKSEEQKQKEREKEINQIKQIEEWTGLYFGDILFDSELNNWKQNINLLNNKIKSRKQLLFIIEDDRNEKFGYYLDTIVKNEYNDSYYTWTNIKSFHFNIESNGRLNKTMKFPIKNINKGYSFCSNSSLCIMKLGNIVLTLNKPNQSFCLQVNDNDFDYHGIENALCGRTLYKENNEWKGDYFTLSRLKIIQMESYEDQQKRQLEIWTGLHCGDILFDSDKDDWDVKTSVFDDKIMGKKQLLFIIEDEDGEKFGYYLNTEIKNEYNYSNISTFTDKKSFEFNIHSKNKRLTEMKKYEIKDTRYGYSLYPKIDNRLITLGDITLNKNYSREKSYCNQRNERYNYQGIDKALCGKTRMKENNEWKGETFSIERIVVIQMFD